MEKTKHILVVDDEKKITQLVSDYLVKEGFKTSCHYHGDGVLDMIHSDSPDLVILDLMLPGTDGVTLCREIRKFSSIPIIMLTAKVDEIDRLVGLEMGADDYICKPFSPREVVARVKAVLRRSSKVEPEKIKSVGDINIDDEKREVHVKGMLITLTPSEFGLLQVLMGAPGKVFSRTELVDRVQGYSFDGYERTIDSHIKNLRKKLSDGVSGKDYISTVYGVGYKLDL